MKSTLFRLFLLVCSLGLMLPALRAEDLGTVKARMNQRLGNIDHLKASGSIGENLRGYLEMRDGSGSAAAVVSAENADRETVYAAIAKQTGSSSETVGRARARQIAAGSAPGVWLQREDGSWHKK
ncbi:MAG TPA: YdbL family protein [Opitutaceae bacterium]|nr:YdbL family protein [Opitutaceae bacterium]